MVSETVKQDEGEKVDPLPPAHLPHEGGMAASALSCGTAACSPPPGDEAPSSDPAVPVLVKEELMLEAKEEEEGGKLVPAPAPSVTAGETAPPSSDTADPATQANPAHPLEVACTYAQARQQALHQELQRLRLLAPEDPEELAVHLDAMQALLQAHRDARSALAWMTGELERLLLLPASSLGSAV